MSENDTREHDTYDEEKLKKIRATLSNVLEDTHSFALDHLDKRFLPEEAVRVENEEKKIKEEEARKKKSGPEKRAAIPKRKLLDILSGLEDVQEDVDKARALIEEVSNHPQTKAFHLVEMMDKLRHHPSLVDILAKDIATRKGLNPMIDALHCAVNSPEAIKILARSIAEKGTVNHIIRAIGTAPKQQPYAETLWTTEIMYRGNAGQMLEALNLLESDSPGLLILATGLVHREEIGIEPLVRATQATKENYKASAILAVKLAQLCDSFSLVSLLESHVSDTSYAGQVLVAKLVHQSLYEKGHGRSLVKAAGFMRGKSMAGHMLAMGILELSDVELLEKSYNRMKFHPTGQQMLAVGIARKAGKLKAMRILGSQLLSISKIEAETEKKIAEARKFHDLLLEVLPIV